MNAIINDIYAWGLEVIRAVQTIANPVLTSIVRIITLLGDPIAYIIILPIIFWCIDEKKGFRLGFITLISAGFNIIIKETFKVPRPFLRDPSVGLIPETGYSTPSAHAQCSGTFWGLAATTMKSKWRWAAGLGVPFIIGLTRIYLGVHYPSDVIFGWLLAVIFVAAAYFTTPLIEKHIVPLPAMIKILFLAVLVFIMNTLCITDTSMPAAILGFGAGYILLTAHGGFNAAEGKLWQKLLRLPAGIAGLLLIYLGLKLLAPAEGHPNYQLFRFIRYLLLGIWAGFIAPKLFIALKLAQKRENAEPKA